MERLGSHIYPVQASYLPLVLGTSHVRGQGSNR